MPLRFLDDPAPTLGMVRDAASWRLQPGQCYDLLNMLNDKSLVTRQRMGSTALVSGAQTAFATLLGFCYSQDATPIEELYGANGKTGVVSLINKTSGAASTISTVSFTGTFGRPVRHFGFLVFPCGTMSLSGAETATVAGATGSATFTNTAAVTITASNKQITLTGADVTTNIQVGSIVTGANAYVGRVVSVDTTKLFSVWPVPAAAFSVGAGNLTAIPVLSTEGGGRCAASFQNRLLSGNTYDISGLLSTGTKTRSDRRVNYSILPTETGVGTAGVPIYGAPFLFPTFSPPLNYFDVPGSDPIVAMEPVSDNELLILTGTHPVIFRGNLTTQLATTSPTVTSDLSEINEPYGCLSDLSVQRTPSGIVWAGAGGIYAYAGGRIKDLTRGLINGYWRSLTGNTTSFALHGSAYVRGQYIVSGAAGGTTFSLACDLNASDPKWTRLSGAGTDIFYGIARPTNPAQVFAARWWDQTGAAPSMTNGQTLRIESMMAPYVAGATTTDADGTAVTLGLTTRTVTGDPELVKMPQRVTIGHQQSSTTAAVAVSGQSKLDSADISAASVRALGSLSNTSVLTITNATNANPIVCTTSANHGLQSDDFVDIDGVTGNTNANGKWRIVVTGNTTFSLIGGIGNGAFGGSPTCKKLTETVFSATPLNAGQGVSYAFSGAPNNFELHNIRTTVLQREP